jgi:aryl-alcohol dehydrogenase-like predicted oxidoreductase
VGPVLEEIQAERDDLRIVKLNTDENPQTAGSYGIMSIPTMILFKHGQPVKQIVGAKPKRALEAELVPALERFGVGLLPYFPLASGLLTGKYRRGAEAPEGTRLSFGMFTARLNAAPWDVIEQLESFAQARSLTLLDVAIGGLAAKPTVGSVIAGATSAEQVRANVAAGAWVPSAEDLAELDRITAA